MHVEIGVEIGFLLESLIHVPCPLLHPFLKRIPDLVALKQPKTQPFQYFHNPCLNERI